MKSIKEPRVLWILVFSILLFNAFGFAVCALNESPAWGLGEIPIAVGLFWSGRRLVRPVSVALFAQDRFVVAERFNPARTESLAYRDVASVRLDEIEIWGGEGIGSRTDLVIELKNGSEIRLWPGSGILADRIAWEINHRLAGADAST